MRNLEHMTTPEIRDEITRLREQAEDAFDRAAEELARLAPAK
jgi:hypothetical protein